MSTRYDTRAEDERLLDWLRQYEAGRSCWQIAEAAGVKPWVVSRRIRSVLVAQ